MDLHYFGTILGNYGRGGGGVSDFLGIRGLVSRYFGNKSSMVGLHPSGSSLPDDLKNGPNLVNPKATFQQF